MLITFWKCDLSWTMRAHFSDGQFSLRRDECKTKKTKQKKTRRASIQVMIKVNDDRNDGGGGGEWAKKKWGASRCASVQRSSSHATTTENFAAVRNNMQPTVTRVAAKRLVLSLHSPLFTCNTCSEHTSHPLGGGWLAGGLAVGGKKREKRGASAASTCWNVSGKSGVAAPAGGF